MKVLGLKFILIDEDTGQQLATKYARIHKTDIEAGKYMIETKKLEILKDIESVIG